VLEWTVAGNLTPPELYPRTVQLIASLPTMLSRPNNVSSTRWIAAKSELNSWQGREKFSLQQRLDHLWSPPSHPFRGCKREPSRVKTAEALSRSPISICRDNECLEIMYCTSNRASSSSAALTFAREKHYTLPPIKYSKTLITI